MAVFRSALTIADFMPTSDTATVAGVYTQLGKRQIQAGELLSLGFGAQSDQAGAQGRIFVDIRDNSASPGVVVKGKLRLTAYTPQMRPLVILGEYRIETLNANATDRTKWLPLNESIYQISEDKFLVLEFMPDTGSPTISHTNSTAVIDITEVQA